jgi:pimeloyl-ACP methyl ester carboxylesterase
VSAGAFLHAGGTRLEARWIGEPSAARPTLVFLHEGLGSVAQWRDFPDRVSAALGLAALVYSRRGYGGSDPVSPAPRPVRFMHDEAYDVLPAILAAAGLDRVVLVGHSDGASIALLFAANDRASKRVEAVIVLAPHLFVEDVTVKSIAAMAEAWKTTDAARVASEGVLPCEPARELRARLARYHGANVDGAFLGWSGAWLAPEFRRWNIEREVAAIDVPVLAIQGVDDEYGTSAQLEALKRTARGGVVTRLIANCGHSPQRDQPDATIEAIAAWWTSLRSGPAEGGDP